MKKSANISITLSLAKELGSTGITVNTVSPGPITTPGTRDLFHAMPQEKNMKGDWEEIEKKSYNKSCQI